MGEQYWYFYFLDKRERNSFVDRIDKDERLKKSGIHTANVVNELTCNCYWCQRDRKECWFTMVDGVRKDVPHYVYLAVLTAGDENLNNMVFEHFKVCNGHRDEKHDSPYEFGVVSS